MAITGASLLLAASAAAHGPLRSGGAGPRLAVAGGLGAAASQLAPGDTVTRPLRVSNPGSFPVQVLLAAQVADERSPGRGGRLSQRLRLEVRRAGASRAVYAGRLPAMPTLRLGRLLPHGHARYLLRLHFDDSGDGYQGAGLRLRLSWTAVADG